MLNRNLIVAGLMATAAASAWAEEPASPHSLTGNLTFATNYHVRGLSQTNFRPAIQGTVEYGHSSGFYAGLFGSNVSWYADAWEEAAPGKDSNIYGGTVGQAVAISNSLELDGYLGFRNKFAGDFSYDFGAIYYYYPGKYEISANTAFFGIKKPDTGEVYAGLGWKWISAKLYYAVTSSVFGVDDAQGSMYGDVTATVPIGDTGFNVIGHVGAWDWAGSMLVWQNAGLDNSVYNAVDYKLGVTKDFLGFSWGLYYWGSDADSTTPVPLSISASGSLAVWGNRYGKNVGDDTVFLTISKAF